MLYYIRAIANGIPLIWPNMTRSTGTRIIKRVLPDSESITISVEGASSHFATYDPHEDCWDVCKHANGRSLYYGRSYKTLSGALNKLNKLAETEARV